MNLSISLGLNSAQIVPDISEVVTSVQSTAGGAEIHDLVDGDPITIDGTTYAGRAWSTLLAAGPIILDPLTYAGTVEVGNTLTLAPPIVLHDTTNPLTLTYATDGTSTVDDSDLSAPTVLIDAADADGDLVVTLTATENGQSTPVDFTVAVPAVDTAMAKPPVVYSQGRSANASGEDFPVTNNWPAGGTLAIEYGYVRSGNTNLSAAYIGRIDGVDQTPILSPNSPDNVGGVSLLFVPNPDADFTFRIQPTPSNGLSSGRCGCVIRHIPEDFVLVDTGSDGYDDDSDLVLDLDVVEGGVVGAFALAVGEAGGPDEAPTFTTLTADVSFATEAADDDFMASAAGTVGATALASTLRAQVASGGRHVGLSWSIKPAP